MGYVFEVEGETVWSPSLDIGHLFMDIANRLSEDLKQSHGMSLMASDFIDIDRDAFAAFVRSMLNSSVMTNLTYYVLSRGFLATCLAMLERAGSPVAPQNSEQQDLVAFGKALLGHMPTN
ncbi:hypothetical protein LX15_004967 [Streptoalloteichus tenebrarius]|uniref:Uncharacterized protein n=1 Tax=Streptoalloteichus tenebrarius (strain ATCC 17920 / DSM 40477 / JCM 4838 / CBS 697.72 / NBRC 16177 / NCIMB 11028 / NRRL B-12390 / A12253. 1 / ISP 5477) TaxID=1933 RepID=Q2MF26_STRSD|nr:DUF6086 family protein [Streptoalloteichus tenebrarius]MCP2261246.1 hypothetical protein [Streptoalloteichus tenebrarius]BFF04438.1 hypothetical protein GCM10020241_61130 [Streptoalloteichus tenebrarius]CAH18546.1 hypothetical protein [Streptoalloteichus tenebrarius]